MGGIPGPPPKKDAERRRRNKTGSDERSHIPATVVNVDELLVGEVEVPTPDESWHPIARQIYDSVLKSGQVIWMEPSDWSVLYLLCESLSRDLKPQVIGINEESGEPVFAVIPLKGSSLNAYTKTMASLMMLEGDRRRLRIELERQKRLDAAAEGGTVVDIVQHRADVFKGA